MADARPRRAILSRSGYYTVPRATSEEIMREGHEAHSLWCALRSRARHEPTTIETRFGPVELQRGQALIALRTLSDDLKIERTKIRRCLLRWERRGLISVGPIRTVGAQLAEQSAAHLNAPLPTIVTLNDYEVSAKSEAKTAQSSAHAPRTSRSKIAPEEEGKRRKRGKRKPIPTSISEGQYLFLANRIAKWRSEVGHLYVGGNEESYAHAFLSEFAFTVAYWDGLKQQFAIETDANPPVEESAHAM